MTAAPLEAEFPGRRCLLGMGLSAVGDKGWPWVCASLWMQGLLPGHSRGLGFAAPVGRRQSHAAGQHPWEMPNPSPGCLLQSLSWLLALDSSVTTLWSASQEPELSFQLAGTLGLCCILLCLPGSPLFRLQRVFPTHSLCVPVLSDDPSPSHGVLRLPGLCVLLFALFASLCSWDYSGQLKGRA